MRSVRNSATTVEMRRGPSQIVTLSLFFSSLSGSDMSTSAKTSICDLPIRQSLSLSSFSCRVDNADSKTRLIEIVIIVEVMVNMELEA